MATDQHQNLWLARQPARFPPTKAAALEPNSSRRRTATEHREPPPTHNTRSRTSDDGPHRHLPHADHQQPPWLPAVRNPAEETRGKGPRNGARPLPGRPNHPSPHALRPPGSRPKWGGCPTRHRPPFPSPLAPPQMLARRHPRRPQPSTGRRHHVHEESLHARRAEPPPADHEEGGLTAAVNRAG
nr:protein TRACHEARY ELEMENT DIFFERENTIATION-RELATED 7A-like [Lolium perenne]